MILNNIANRNTALINQKERGEITQQAYLAMQFPADAPSVIEKAIHLACEDWEGNNVS